MRALLPMLRIGSRSFALPILALALVTTSCKSTLAGTISTPISVGENIRPLDADVSVDVTKKIEGESNSLYFLIFRLSGDKKYARYGLNLSARHKD
jgi:hypothetical protein